MACPAGTIFVPGKPNSSSIGPREWLPGKEQTGRVRRTGCAIAWERDRAGRHWPRRRPRVGYPDSLFVGAPGQPGKSLLLENQGYRDRADALALSIQGPTDVINGKVLFSQSHDPLPHPVSFGRGLRPLGGRQEELPFWVLAEVVTEDAKLPGV